MPTMKININIKSLIVRCDVDYDGCYEDDVRAGLAALVTEIINPDVQPEAPKFSTPIETKHERFGPSSVVVDSLKGGPPWSYQDEPTPSEHNVNGNV